MVRLHVPASRRGFPQHEPRSCVGAPAPGVRWPTISHDESPGDGRLCLPLPRARG